MIILISASADSFGACAENCKGIYAAADTVQGVKENVHEAIALYRELNPSEDWPEAIRDSWPIEWRYDTQSLLKYYQGIFTNAALGRLTGINDKQLWNYANGVSKPRKAAREKIEKALHSLGSELCTINLI